MSKRRAIAYGVWFLLAFVFSWSYALSFKFGWPTARAIEDFTWPLLLLYSIILGAHWAMEKINTFNGWQRIGVVASVIWIVAGGVYTMNQPNHAARDFQACLDLTPPTVSGEACTAAFRANYPHAAAYQRTQALITMFVPVLLGWFAVYLALGTYQWVRRGFTDHPA